MDSKRKKLVIFMIPLACAVFASGCVSRNTPVDAGIRDQAMPVDNSAESDRKDSGRTHDVAVEIMQSPGRRDCQACETDKDCATGYHCVRIGSGKACLKGCEYRGDCLSGYICYAVSTEFKACVPPSYKCVECAVKGCPDGKVCDLGNGDCKARVPVCGPCMLDWECGMGHRCYHKDMDSPGICTPECKTGADCPQPQDRYTCVPSEGVQICIPDDLDVCCPSDKPHMLDRTCVQCISSADCDNGDICNPQTHTCSPNGCPTSQKLCEDDNQCHQCCQDSDCPNSYCVHHNCYAPPPCDCPDPNFPYCVNYQGNWTCAACDPDEPDSCPAPCQCDPNSFVCLTSDGYVCGPCCCLGCNSDNDCVNSYGKKLKCSDRGFCYDPAGFCDDDAACCDEPSGSKCFDIMYSLFGGMGGLPGLPDERGGMGVCSCDYGAQCPDGLKCYELDEICAMPVIGDLACPDGKLPDNAPRRICKDPKTLINGM